MNPLRALINTRVNGPYRDKQGFKVYYHSLDGKRQWIRLTATTRTEALDQRQQIEEAIKSDPRIRSGAAYTLAEWRVKFKELNPQLAPRTLAAFDNAVKHLIDTFGDAAPLASITPMQAAEFAAGLSDLARATRAKIIRHLKRWFRVALRTKAIGENPFADISGSNPAIDQTWTFVSDADTEAMIRACNSPGEAMLIALCRWAGLRRGEAARLDWMDVDLERRRLAVTNPQRVQTTKRRARVVPIVPRLAKALGAVPEAARVGLVVAGGRRSRGGYKAIRGVQRRAGLALQKPTHCLRKSRVTSWIEEGHDPYAVAKWTGHSVAVAQAHYHKPTEAAMDRAAFAPAVTKKPRRGQKAAARKTRKAMQGSDL